MAIWKRDSQDVEVRCRAVQEAILSSTSSKVLSDEPMSRHTTIGIGGKAALFVEPANLDDLKRIIEIAKANGIQVFILGAGSNVLFRDGGFNGVVVSLTNFASFSKTGVEDGKVYIKAGAGVRLNTLLGWAKDEGLSGFEALAGIPGTVGGALAMNAGTHDGCISDHLVKVSALDFSGKFYEWERNKIEFGYRSAKYPKPAVIVEAEFELLPGDKKEIEQKMEKLIARRKERHPLEYPSLGSIFINPSRTKGGDRISAAILIEECGLKGVRIGGARISPKHANWIVNERNASSKDVERLISLVKDKVRERCGVLLNTEIIIVGDEV